jgi:hypothetical protein
MFGFGTKRQVRHKALGSHRMRNAAVAGIGMLAWKWWRNRQQSGQPTPKASTSYSDRSFSESSRRGTDSL